MRKNEGLTDKVYALPFSRAYWTDAVHALKSTRLLTTTALLCAVCALVDTFFLPLGGAFLRIQFSFLIAAVLNAVCGPCLALPAGFLVDLLSFVCSGGDPAGYFPGYAVSSMLAFLIYALFFFRARLSFLRVFLARLTVNVFVNVIVGSVWKSMLYGKAYRVYFVSGAIKNLGLLPLETIALYFLLSRLFPVMHRTELAPRAAEVVSVKKRDVILSVLGAAVGAAVLVWYYYSTLK